jgi:predicted dinucleotide-binding enzyme
MRVIFIGTGDIGLPVLRWLEKSDEHKLIGVVTQPDKPVGREQRITPPPIKTALTSSAIPVLQPRRIKAPEAVEEIRALAPEVIVVMAYGQILPRGSGDSKCRVPQSARFPAAATSRRGANSGGDPRRRSRHRDYRHVHG